MIARQCREYVCEFVYDCSTVSRVCVHVSAAKFQFVCTHVMLFFIVRYVTSHSIRRIEFSLQQLSTAALNTTAAAAFTAAAAAVAH